MVTRQQLTQEAWRGLDRGQRVELALEIGEYEFAEWMKVVGFDEDLTPEWDAEDARVVAERLAHGKFVSAEEIEARWEVEDAEEEAWVRMVEAKFPGAIEQMDRFDLDPYTPESREFFFMIHEAFPEDMDEYLGADYFFRAAL